ncbi:MAG: endonuclease/exonuclease/phosphatase family protein [Saprospiraceae bacterium]
MKHRLVFLLAAVCWAFAAPAQSFTALTYNIRYDNPNDGPDHWDVRKAALADEILRHRPAIVGLQEATIRQLQYLDTRLLGYQRFGVGREDGAEKGEFSPIYFDTSMFRLLNGRTIWLSRTPKKPSKGWDAACERIATLLELQSKHSGDTILMVNTHWDHVGKKARMRSAKLIVCAIKDALRAGRRVIFMGDLNATPDDAPIQFLQKHLTSTCPPDQSERGTFNGFDPTLTVFRRIDYVWFSPADWKIESYEVPHPMLNGRHVSDHFPVVVRFEW